MSASLGITWIMFTCTRPCQQLYMRELHFHLRFQFLYNLSIHKFVFCLMLNFWAIQIQLDGKSLFFQKSQYMSKVEKKNTNVIVVMVTWPRLKAQAGLIHTNQSCYNQYFYRYGTPTGYANSWHLVPSHLGLAYVLIVEISLSQCFHLFLNLYFEHPLYFYFI